MVFDVEITNLRGEVLATTRSDRAGDGPGGADPLVFTQYRDLEVEIPNSDSRMARVTFAMENPAVEHLSFQGEPDDEAETHLISALGRMLRIYYRKADNPQPVFWGPVLMLRAASAQEGTVVVEAHDQTLRLKKHFARYGDDVVGESTLPEEDKPLNPLDYRTIFKLVEAGENTPSQNHYPHLGIYPGVTASPTPWIVTVIATGGTFTLTVAGETTGTIAYNASAATMETELEALSNVAVGEVTVTKPSAGVWQIDFTGDPEINDYEVTGAGSGLTGTGAALGVNRAQKVIQRGANVWDEIVAVHESRYGPEFEFEPRDDLGPVAFDNDLEPWPYVATLNTYDTMGTDRSGTFTFKYSSDADANLKGFEWNPSGDVVRNTVTAVTQGENGEDGLRVFGHDLGAWRDVGIYVDWQNPAGGNSTEVTEEGLQDLANDIVRAYARPPQFLTLARSLVDAQNPSDCFLDPYGVGDFVSVEIQKGYVEINEVVRIMKVTLRQHDAAGNVEEIIEVVPKVTNQANVTTGAD